MTPEQKARLAELRAKVGGQSKLTPEQSSRLQELRAKAGIGTAAPKRGLLQAAFPTATQDRQPREVPMPFYSGMPGGPQLTRTMGSREQAVPATLLDALTLGTRAAGTAGGALGFEGATGGKTGLEALADPETGLARPARDMLQQMMAQRMQEGGLLGKLDLIPLGLGYLGSSVAEDPFAALGLAAKPITAAAGGIARGGRRMAGALDRFAGRFAEEASGVPEEALRAYGTQEGRAAIQANAGKEFEIGQDLVNMVENFDQYLPEREVVNQILERMPGISPAKVIEALRRSRMATTKAPGRPAQIEVSHPKQELKASNLKPEEGPARNRSFDQLTGDPEIKVKDAGEPGKDLAPIPTGDAVNKKIDDLIGRLKLVAGENVDTGVMGKIPAKKFRDIRIDYDSEAKAAFKKDDRELYERALMNARNQMAADLRDAARSSGDPEFVTKMESYSDKLDKLERVKKFLGQNAESREARAEGFISNLTNANKTYQQQLISDLEGIFDKDLMTRIKGAKHAKQLGKEGRPAILPRQFTGRSNLAQSIGGTLTLPLSSPAIASRGTLPLLRKLATAKVPAEADFYAKALKRMGVAAAEIDAARSASEAFKSLNVIPFRKVAEKKDQKKEPIAYGQRQ